MLRSITKLAENVGEEEAMEIQRSYKKVGRSINGQALPLAWLPGQWTVNSRDLRKRLTDNWEERAWICIENMIRKACQTLAR